MLTLDLNYQVTSVTFNDTSDLVFFGGVDNQVRAWNLRRNEVEFSLVGHTETVTGISLSNDGNFLLSNAMDNTLRYIPRGGTP